MEKSLLINELPRARFCEAMDICQWEGFWFEPSFVGPAMTFQSNFHARDDDVLFASTIKTGTTWLKSHYVSIITQNRHRNQITTISDILNSKNLHYLVPTIESTMYSTKSFQFEPYDSSTPRLIHTHLPYLSVSVKNSPCKTVYIARNPKDTVISMWHFFNSILQQEETPFPMEKAYDELKTEPKRHVSKIVEFLGRLFKNGYEGELVEELNVPNSSFLRKGEVGGWKNYLTAKMEEMIDQTSRIKLEPFGLFL
ncbi:hypothetical protein ABFX02_06G119900 [Erythranthe guttata]